MNRNPDELYRWWFNCVHNQSEYFIRIAIEFRNQFIGYVDLAGIQGNTAELGIATSEIELWGKGIGAHSLFLMMVFATKELGITIFDAITHEANIRSQKMLEKMEFKEIDRLDDKERRETRSEQIHY